MRSKYAQRMANLRERRRHARVLWRKANRVVDCQDQNARWMEAIPCPLFLEEQEDGTGKGFSHDEFASALLDGLSVDNLTAVGA